VGDYIITELEAQCIVIDPFPGGCKAGNDIASVVIIVYQSIIENASPDGSISGAEVGVVAQGRNRCVGCESKGSIFRGMHGIRIQRCKQVAFCAYPVVLAVFGGISGNAQLIGSVVFTLSRLLLFNMYTFGFSAAFGGEITAQNAARYISYVTFHMCAAILTSVSRHFQQYNCPYLSFCAKRTKLQSIMSSTSYF